MAIAMQYGNGRNGLLNVGMSMTLLWTNVDDESAFAAQTLSLNIGGYDAVLIKFKLAANVSTYANTIGFVGEQTTLFSSNASTTSYTYKRYATVTTSDITFSTGYRGATVGTSYAIPCEVYGIKRGGSSGGSSSSGSSGGGGGTGTLTQVTFDGTVYTDDGTGNVTLSESDPVFVASDAYSITSTDITNWNSKVGSLADLGITATATELNYTDGVTSNIQDQLDSMARAVSFTATGTIASFVDGEGGKAFVDLVANIEPVQSGSGDPSPSNIRPISGWTGCNVTRAGKNLKNLEFSQVNSSNILTNTFSLKAGTYTLSVNYIGTPTWGIYLRNGSIISSPVIKNAYNTTSLTFTLNRDYSELCVSMYYGNGITVSEVTDIQLELGSSATAYEPYQGETVTVDWTTEAGTVYGGTIDVATGLLTVTDGYIASYNGEALPSTWISDRDVYSSGTTPTTGAQVVYTLATPQTYQLTPRDVYTLLGTNNVWADTGDITVRYIDVASDYFVDKSAYKSGQLLQDKNLAYVENGTRASRAYSVNNYFINADGVLCRITASVSSGGTLIQGTNYIVVTGGLANDLYSLLS